MWWQHGKERLLEKVNGLEGPAMQFNINIIAAKGVCAPEAA
jgi:hypothetical protein